jgi:hypothetical protein
MQEQSAAASNHAESTQSNLFVAVLGLMVVLHCATPKVLFIAIHISCSSVDPFNIICRETIPAVIAWGKKSIIIHNSSYVPVINFAKDL